MSSIQPIGKRQISVNSGQCLPKPGLNESCIVPDRILKPNDPPAYYCPCQGKLTCVVRKPQVFIVPIGYAGNYLIIMLIISIKYTCHYYRYLSKSLKKNIDFNATDFYF